MPEIDHRVGQQFEAKVMQTYMLKPQKQSFEFILPSENALYCLKSFFKNELLVDSFSSPLYPFAIPRVFFDVRDHARIENRFSIGKAIVS